MEPDPPEHLTHDQRDSSAWEGVVRKTEQYVAGHGVATAHHGELFQGVMVGSDGNLRRGLVSLPCSLFNSKATFVPDTTGTIRVSPPWKFKAREAARTSLEFFGRTDLGGELTIQSDVPVGWGLGSSTSDVTAAIYAVADSLRVQIDAPRVALLAVKAETASDSVMFQDNTVLFAQREGLVIEDFECSIPPLEVLGFNTDSLGSGLDTLSYLPARYSWWEVEAFRPLVGLLRRALESRDAHLIGHVASASAKINQHHLPKPRFARLMEMVDEVGAVGLEVAHSGTVVGFLFDPSETNMDERVDNATGLVEEMGFGATWRFRTGRNGISVGVGGEAR